MTSNHQSHQRRNHNQVVAHNSNPLNSSSANNGNNSGNINAVITNGPSGSNVAETMPPGPPSHGERSKGTLNICMVSDFFYPNMGGVESHLYCLSECLIKRGHKVIIITHAYGNRVGVRYLSNGLKAYYIPFPIVYSSASLPTIFSFFPIFRNIVVREEIDVVHGHQAFSSLCHEAIFHAKTMGLKAVFTDHSLFGFADTSSILMNKMSKFTLSDVDHVICVSNTSRENTVLRAALSPQHVSVIPNAIIASQFTPNPRARDPKSITVVVCSRLVYRKGMDLLVAIIPKLCALHPRLRFVIGGDGPKRIDLEQMREKYLLHDRVELLGAIRHSQVRNVLVRGNIFLNTSLTEAFCIAIVEAASCGLLVVSTKVGGVPEVLPSHMILFSKPEEDNLVKVVSDAIKLIESEDVETSTFHDQVKRMYSWDNIAERTELVYHSKSYNFRLPLIERLRRYFGCGKFAGKLFCFLVLVDYLLWLLLEHLYPRILIDKCKNVPLSRWKYELKHNRVK